MCSSRLRLLIGFGVVAAAASAAAVSDVSDLDGEGLGD